MPVEDELVQVGGLLGGEPVQAKVIQNEQVGCEEGPEARSKELSTRDWAMARKKP